MVEIRKALECIPCRGSKQFILSLHKKLLRRRDLSKCLRFVLISSTVWGVVSSAIAFRQTELNYWFRCAFCAAGFLWISSRVVLILRTIMARVINFNLLISPLQKLGEVEALKMILEIRRMDFMLMHHERFCREVWVSFLVKFCRGYFEVMSLLNLERF